MLTMTRTGRESKSGAKHSFIAPRAGEANEPHSRSSEVVWDQLLAHIRSYELAPCQLLEHSPQPRPFCCPPRYSFTWFFRLSPGAELPTSHGEITFLPPCTQDEPHSSKNVHGTKAENEAIISGKLCPFLVRLPVMFRRRGMNRDEENEIHSRGRRQ